MTAGLAWVQWVLLARELQSRNEQVELSQDESGLCRDGKRSYEWEEMLRRNEEPEPILERRRHCGGMSSRILN